MTHDAQHEQLIKELTEQFVPLFEQSTQGIYLYLDDEHKVCNKKFADMLGYKSADEWAANEYPVEDVDEEDRDKAIHAFVHASEHGLASALSGTWIAKDGTKIKTDVIMVPIPYKDELFVLHFITPKK